MNKEEIQAFSMRITQGSRSDLVVTTYDIILKYIEDGKNAYAEGNTEEFAWNMKKANEFLHELMSALDLQYGVSRNLFSIYRYVQKMFIQAKMGKTPESLKGIPEILSNLREGFVKVAEEDKSGQAMEKAGQVYAGMTYGKSSLNEIYERKHGFEA